MVKIFPIKTNSKIKNITRIVKDWSTLEEQWVKGLALSLLWYGFDPWPGNFYTLRVQPRKKKQKRSSKVIQFKIDMEESTAFLYTSNNQFFKCQDRENPNCPTTSLLIFFFFFFFFFSGCMGLFLHFFPSSWNIPSLPGGSSKAPKQTLVHILLS